MKRKLSLLMVLMMIVSLIPMASFAALSDVVRPVVVSPTLNVSGATTTIVRAESYVEMNLADLGVSTVSSTNPATLQFDDGAAVEAVSFRTTSGAIEVELTNDEGVNRAGNRVIIAPTTAATASQITVYVKTAATSGRKVVEVAQGTTFESYLYAEVSGASTGASLTQSKRTIRRATNQLAAGFVVRRPEGNSVTLELPRGFEWNTNTRVVVGGEVATFGNSLSLSGTENRRLVITRTATNELSGTNFVTDEITVIPRIDVTRDARLGDVTLRIDSNEVRTDLVIAAYKDYGVNVEVAEVQEIVAGKTDTSRDYLVKVTLSGISGSITEGRDIEMTFNNGRVRDFGSTRISNIYRELDGQRVTNLVTDPYANFVSFQADHDEKIELEFYVTGDWNAGGEDLTVDIKGRDINEQDLVLAKIAAPVTVQAAPVTDVRLGVQRQAVSDIVITETEAEALERGTYFITLSEDTDFFGAYFNPTNLRVVAEEGDLDFTYRVNRNNIELTVTRESREATKLVVSGITVSLDRTLPEGPLDARFVANFNTTRLDNGTIVEFPYLDVTNAAPGTGTLRPTTVFTLGSVTYTVGNETKTLDAAPYISNNRTMLPIGTVAQLVGATVNYSPTTRTAVFTKDNLVVTMNLDTNILLVNGSPVAMDSKPEIVNSRAFVPVVFVAQAFGIQNNTDIVYDATNRTVTIFPAN